MKILDRPPQDSVALFDRIVERKKEPRRSVLLDLRVQVLAAYCAYEEAAPDVHTLPPSNRNAEQCGALLHCYESRNSPFDEVYRAILESSYFCPYCEIVQVQCLDHFLDKASYPELAVLPVNLVPACTTCNRPRPGGIVEDGERSLMHPYFDSYPTQQLLCASLERDGIRWRATFHVELERTPESDLFRRHHALLDLLPRYRAWAEEEELPNLLRDLAVWGRSLGVAPALATLRVHAERLRGDLGANHPRAVLHQAAAEFPDFVGIAIEEGP